MRGSKTAIEIKEATGTVNKTRARREAEIRYDGKENFEITLPPDHLSEEAQTIWLKIVAQHASIGLNFPSHYEYLETYCRMYDIRNETWEEIREGKYQINDKGLKTINPAWKIHTEAIRIMHEIGSKLGLTAADKSRISTAILSDNVADKNNQKRIPITGRSKV